MRKEELNGGRTFCSISGVRIYQHWKKKKLWDIGQHHETELITVCKVGFVTGQVGYRPKIVNQCHAKYAKIFLMLNLFLCLQREFGE
jgi:hypothetical protein